ncbi:MAG: VRR-NUC domain-containing protein [Bacteroidota bacterium]
MKQQTELQIQQKIWIAVSKKYGDRVRLFRNFVGTAYKAQVVAGLIKLLMNNRIEEAKSLAKKAQPLRIGTPGTPDLQGFVAVNGRLEYLGLEVKAPGGKQRPEQKKFQAMIDGLGGHYLLCQSVEEALEKVGNILK